MNKTIKVDAICWEIKKSLGEKLEIAEYWSQ